jgi:rSAM/selenodomain-associated transferase 2
VISVIIPTLNAQAHLPRSLPPLVQGVFVGLIREVIVTDGGSRDSTLEIADAAGCVIVEGERGRGAQLMRGAEKARSDWMLFLHADTALAPPWIAQTQAFLHAAPDAAGYFRFAPDRDDFAARRLAFWVGLRCRLFALPYGDQGLLIARDLYARIGGFRPIPLMEDVDLVRRLGRRRLRLIKADAMTSVEKHARDGYTRRSLHNLWLLLRFLAGADPADLARRYD